MQNTDIEKHNKRQTVVLFFLLKCENTHMNLTSQTVKPEPLCILSVQLHLYILLGFFVTLSFASQLIHVYVWGSAENEAHNERCC